jgi:hypothetical protein
VSRRRKEVAQFDPLQTTMKLGALKAAIATAHKIENWEALNKAINEIVAEQHAVVGWWDGTVASPGNFELSSKGDNSIPAKDATAQTGVTKQQASRWRTRLQTEEEYRRWLAEPARRL